MRIAQVIGSFQSGGAERVALEIAAGLAKRGWKMEMISLLSQQEGTGITPFDEPLRSEAVRRGLFVRSLPLHSIRSGSARERITNYLREEEISLIHAHNRPGDWQMVLLSARAGVPAIYTRHLPYKDLTLRQRGLYAAAALRAKAVVAVSKTVTRHLVFSEGVPPWKIRTIYNGIDLEKFRPISAEERVRRRREMDFDERDFVWICAARLAPQKGHRFLLEAFARLPEGSRSRLLIVGDGPEMAALTGLAGRLELKEKVRFLGMRTDVPGLLAISDGYVCSSLSEGHPLSILEALAMELPVVAPRLPSVAEIAAEGAPSFYGPRLREWARGHDPAQIVQALLAVEREEWAQKELGKISRLHIEENYSLEKMIDAHEALYTEILR